MQGNVKRASNKNNGRMRDSKTSNECKLCKKGKPLSKPVKIVYRKKQKEKIRQTQTYERRSQEPSAKQCQEVKVAIAKQGTTVLMEKPRGEAKVKRQSPSPSQRPVVSRGPLVV